jgi:hypothetical protein
LALRNLYIDVVVVDSRVAFNCRWCNDIFLLLSLFGLIQVLSGLWGNQSQLQGAEIERIDVLHFSDMRSQRGGRRTLLRRGGVHDDQSAAADAQE